MKAENIEKVGLLALGIVGTLTTTFIARNIYNAIYNNIDWEIGKAEIDVDQRGIIIIVPITFTTSLPGRITFQNYEGNVYYKDILLGENTLFPFSLSKKSASTTKIETVLNPDIGRLIGSTINDPFEILRIIKNGLRTDGTVYMKAAKKTLKKRIQFDIPLI